jgi:uncharacterized protein (TIGR04255 family)
MSSAEVFPNPLVKQVIFAIRFPNLFFLADRIGEFQIKVMKQFPKSSLLLRRPVVLTDEADTEKLEQMVTSLREKEAGNRVWQFESERGVKLEVTSNLLALISTSHKSYRHGQEACFREVVDSVTGQFYALTQLPVVNRIGLRYIDECPLLKDTSEGFREHYSTVFPLDRFPLEECAVMEYRVDVRRNIHNLRYVESLQGEGKNRKLILDFDAWSENIEPSSTMEVTDQLHDIIWDEFNRTIKDPIREYMRKPAEERDAS